jgi:hypothetical protein
VPAESQERLERCPSDRLGRQQQEHKRPTVSNVNLTLTTVDDNVTIKVDYEVEFDKFERQLSGLGLSYDTHVTIYHFDEGTGPGDQILDFNPWPHGPPGDGGQQHSAPARQRLPDRDPRLAPGGPEQGRRRRVDRRRPSARQPVARRVHR